MSGTSGSSSQSIRLDRRGVLFALAVILTCVAAYMPALQGPFLFDDIPNLLENPLLRIDGRVFDDWRVAVISNDSGLLHRPVAMATFLLNYVAAGDFSPLLFKGTNLAIHLLIGVLVYFLCQALLRTPALAATACGNRQMVALVAAALWLLHPLHVSTVLYVVQRMAQLSCLFTVLGLLVYCRYRLRWSATGASSGELIAAALWLALITAAATLSKENGALLPWLAAVVEVALFRGAWDGRRSVLLARLAWAALLLPVLLVALVLLLSPEMITGRYGGREFSLEERLLTQARLLWRYLGWILLPNIVATGFFHDDIPLSGDLFTPLTTLLSLLAWGTLTVVAFALRRRYPLLLFALLFYLVGHAMESTILPLEMVFEHRNYLPSVGICLLAAVLLFQFGGKIRQLRPRVFVLVALVILSVQLVLRAQAWTDELSLARFNIINHPDSPRANFYYGNTLFERFARADDLGLDEEERKSLAVASRAHFLRMHNLAPGDFPALVMLHQLDTLNFPTLAEENDWLGKLEELVHSERMHASDRTALAALLAFSGTEAGRHGLPRVLSMLERLVERYPRHVDLLALHYKALAAQPDVDRHALRAYLERAVDDSPENRLLYAYLVQYHGTDDIAATYETVRAWMLLDARRRELPVLRRILTR